TGSRLRGRDRASLPLPRHGGGRKKSSSDRSDSQWQWCLLRQHDCASQHGCSAQHGVTGTCFWTTCGTIRVNVTGAWWGTQTATVRVQGTATWWGTMTVQVSVRTSGTYLQQVTWYASFRSSVRQVVTVQVTGWYSQQRSKRVTGTWTQTLQ